MFKRIFRVSECVDACIYTKRAREKSTKLTKLASCVLGRPNCIRRPKTTNRHPTLQSRLKIMLLHCKDIRFMYKFYAPNNHISYRYFHPLNYKNYNLYDKKLLQKTQFRILSLNLRYTPIKCVNNERFK